VTAEAHAQVRFRRALECRNLWGAEDAAREMGKLSLEDALRLVHLYGERGSPKFERAAVKWLRRYLEEGSPELSDIAKSVAGLMDRREGTYE
jgi:hypothetical protein